MPCIPVVENPRRRRRRRGSLSAKQLRAGFGGRARMSTRRRRGRGRRNPPILAALGNPRRKRRSVLGRNYYVAHDVRRRRRNPAPTFGIDLMGGVFVAAGAIGSTVIPGLVRRVVPQIPYTGLMAYVVRLGGTAATAFVVGKLSKERRAPQLVWAGGIALILVDVFRQHLAPRLGLSGLGQDGDFVLTEELEDAIPAGDVAGYVDAADDTMAGYVETDYDPSIMG